MCAVFQSNNQISKPGSKVAGCSPTGIVRHVWAGFARNEILDWWLSKGGVLLDLYAERFAERSEKSRRLIWDDVPRGFVLRGLLDIQSGSPLIKIVTRSSSPEELLQFEHPRMPLLDTPLFERIEIPIEPPDQRELL